jgi:hypothetical protein
LIEDVAVDGVGVTADRDGGTLQARIVERRAEVHVGMVGMGILFSGPRSVWAPGLPNLVRILLERDAPQASRRAS